MKKLRRIILLDSFVESIAETDLALKQRLRLFKTATLISLFVIVGFFIQVSIVLPEPSLVLYLMTCLFCTLFINYFSLPYHKKTKLAFITMLVTLLLLVHLDTYYSGGIKNSANFYLAVIILTAFMLLGTKAGIILTLLSVLHLAYFYLLSTMYTNRINYAFVGDAPRLVYLYYFLSTAISIVVLALQSISIERNKNEVIAAIKKSKNELQLKNLELERKNKELEQFAFVASHDLQEPIGTSSNFAQLLQRQYGKLLDEKGNKYLSYIIHSSERMDALIKELLDYYRIGQEEERVQIDCNQVILEIKADLEKSIEENQATIQSEYLPVILGYPVGIKQLFQNLVMNGIKFKRQGVNPEIQISCRKEDQSFHFSITDNGIGISKEYYDRIFLIFQRLHTRTEYDGSGIGLSHSKKIVELHNGKIWLESTPMVGSTFHFTIV